MTVDNADVVDAATAPTRPPSFLEQLRGLAPVIAGGPLAGIALPRLVSGTMDSRNWEQRKTQLDDAMGAADAANSAAAAAAEVGSATPPTLDTDKAEKSGYLGVDDMRSAGAVATVVGDDGVTRYYVNSKDGAREVLYKDADAYTVLSEMGPKERIKWRRAMWLGGYYDPQSFVGPITMADLTVMQNAMTEANMSGVTWQDATASRIEQGARYGRPITEAEIMAMDDEVPGLIKQYAAKNGITVSDDFIARQQKRVLNGKDTPESVLERLRDNFVKPMYPQFEKELDDGLTLEDIASPYVEMAASLLELPSNAIDMNDPLVKRALQARDDAGAPSREPIWKFQERVTSDPRWAQTNNAYESYGSAVNGLLSEMGL